MQIQNAIFDLDGTLIDSMPVWRNIQADAIEENTGIKFTKAEREMCLQYPYFEALDKLRDKLPADCDLGMFTAKAWNAWQRYIAKVRFLSNPWRKNILSI